MRRPPLIRRLRRLTDSGRLSEPARGHQPELAFARCVRSHGVPGFPDPDSRGHFNKQEIRHLPVSTSQLQAARGRQLKTA
ncbi:MAG: hypothetical protein ACRDRJ_31440 [Streptosporangiaceae bacterium]